MFGPLSGLLRQRPVHNQIVRHVSQGGVPGSNLPFSIKGRMKFSLLFIIYFGIGFTAPQLIFVYQMLK